MGYGRLGIARRILDRFRLVWFGRIGMVLLGIVGYCWVRLGPVWQVRIGVALSSSEWCGRNGTELFGSPRYGQAGKVRTIVVRMVWCSRVSSGMAGMERQGQDRYCKVGRGLVRPER